MWVCATKEGPRVNVFDTSDESRSSVRAITKAGYAREIEGLRLRGRLYWFTHPIAVELVQNGEWWNLRAVASRPPHALPDAPPEPSLDLYYQNAVRLAARLLAYPYTCFIDTETTGLSIVDEIISIAIRCKDQRFDFLVRPTNPVSSDITSLTGITNAMLQNAPILPELYDELFKILDGKLWVAYNVRFDESMIVQSCMRYGLLPPVYLGTHDAMMIYSRFARYWDTEEERFIPVKLTEACEEMKIDLENAHSADADCDAMVSLLQAIAAFAT